MLRSTIFVQISFLLFFASACTQRTSFNSDSSTRNVLPLNDDWKFSLDADSGAVLPEYDDQEWRVLDLPHDWSIEMEFTKNAAAGVGGGALPGGTGWYRKILTADERDKGKKFFLTFDGVYCNSDVWINGSHLGNRPNGYISFTYDLTRHIQFEKPNVIVVRADNSEQPNSRWYSGSGIYRNVWLTITGEVYVDQYGTFVSTPEVSKSSARIDIRTVVRNARARSTPVTLNTIIYDSAGTMVASVETSATIRGDSAHTFHHDLNVDKPVLWSVDHPKMYTVVSILKSDGQVIDRYSTPFGIRKFSFDPYTGFSLNGNRMKILGVCNHHDLGSLGAAVNRRALERQLEILKAMGVNAIRTAHNPPAPELLELCDRMGFLVMDEMFDMWKRKKTEYDYSRFWEQWHQEDLKDFIRRDRNHPSVIIWSIGNEIGEQWDSTGTAIAEELATIVRQLDDTRPVTTGNNEVNPYNSIIKSGVLDLIGYNYNHRDYADFHKRYPGKKFIATETTSALATRGYYDMPSDSIRRWPISWDKLFTEGNPDNTVSAYDNVSAPWGSTHEETWKVVKKHDHLSGMFIWTGFDYLGEPTPYVWPSRSSYFGVIDLAGFPKDAYYMYQSEWTNKPVLHVFPHWNWAPGKTVDVWAYYSNADEVELFLNGVSKGIRKKQGEDLHVMWRLAYEPGFIRVISRKDGHQVMAKEIRTAGPARRITLEPDRKSILADGRDLSFVTVTVVDDDGNLVPRANNLINFEIEGAASIAAVDNGDPTSHMPFRGNAIKTFNGLALLVIRGGGTPGKIIVTAKSPGLQSEEITLTLE